MGASVGKDGPMADINVTPLIDVVLVLLVVFMVITPLLSSGLPVDLPQATSSDAEKEGGQHVVVSITKDGEMAVGQETFEDESALALAVSEELIQGEQSADRKVLVKADRDVRYGDARKVIDAIAGRNVPALYFATSKEE
ncbi:MAG: biopolymer transporter ExbD [Myxococcota bacterium]